MASRPSRYSSLLFAVAALGRFCPTPARELVAGSAAPDPLLDDTQLYDDADVAAPRPAPPDEKQLLQEELAQLRRALELERQSRRAAEAKVFVLAGMARRQRNDDDEIDGGNESRPLAVGARPRDNEGNNAETRSDGRERRLTYGGGNYHYYDPSGGYYHYYDPSGSNFYHYDPSGGNYRYYDPSSGNYHYYNAYSGGNYYDQHNGHTSDNDVDCDLCPGGILREDAHVGGNSCRSMQDDATTQASCEVYRTDFGNSCCDFLPEGMCLAACPTTVTATSTATTATTTLDPFATTTATSATTITSTVTVSSTYTDTTTTRTLLNDAWYVSEGSCIEDGECISSTDYPENYPNKDYCVITILPTWTGQMYVKDFQTEADYDFLAIDGTYYSGKIDPASFGRSTPQTIVWRADMTVRRSGWKICWDNETQTSTQTSTSTTTPKAEQGDWNVTSGACEMVGPCISSPNYPSVYVGGDSCRISIGENWTGAIQVEAFDLSWVDMMIVNSEVYSGDEGNDKLTGLVPSGEIVWMTAPDNSFPGSGFKICWDPEATDLRESIQWTCTWKGTACDFSRSIEETVQYLVDTTDFSVPSAPPTYYGWTGSWEYYTYFNYGYNYYYYNNDPNWNPWGYGEGGYNYRRLSSSGLFSEVAHLDACTTFLSDQDDVNGNENVHDGHPWCIDQSGNAEECGPCECAIGQYKEFVQEDLFELSSRSPATYIHCTDCTVGWYSDEAGATECQACTLGWYSSHAGASTCFFCLRGSYSDELASTGCTSCEAGYYQSQFAQTGCKTCEAGTYSNESKAHACTECPAGYYSDEQAATRCEACEEGTYSPWPGYSSCTRCGQGEFSAIVAATACELCPPGYSSKREGSSECEPCPAGLYQEDEGQNFCQRCAPMTYANESASATCMDCPQGYKVEEDSTACEPCEAGWHGTEDGQCEICPWGYYSSSPGSAECSVCQPGTYGGGMGWTECVLCGFGYYSDREGQFECTECPRLTYVNATGSTQCDDCPLGNYINDDRTECLPCDPGTHGDDQGYCVACWFGQYTSAYGQSECTKCNPGFYAGMDRSTTCEVCPPGTYFDDFGAAECTQCGSMTYNNETQATSCYDCPLGYVVSEDSTECTACPKGRYGDSEGCQVCHPGEYTDQDGLSVCSKCPAGSMNSFFEQTACTLCAPGYYMGDEGSTQCESCGSGDYQGSDGATACEVCPLGSIVTSSKTVCQPCPAGQYMNTLYAVQCQLCPLGRASNNTGVTACDECLPGTIGGQAGLTGCIECIPGTYEDDVASERGQCKLCSVGTYTEAYASTACKLCALGYFSNTQSSPSCTACEAGMYADTEGGSSCGTCPIGWYANGTGNPECSPCPSGSIAPGMRTETCFLCEPGRYANSTGSSACTNCDVGSFQESSGESSCRICWQELSPTGKNAHLWATMQQVVFQGETIWSNLAAATSVESCGCMSNAWMSPEGECEDCGEGMTCAGMGEVLLLNGYFAPAGNGGNVWKCFGKSERCPGGLPGTCAPGRMNESLACTSCEDGYRPDKNGQCAICESGDTSIFFVAFVIVVFGLIGMYIMVHRESPTKKNSAVALVLIMMKQFITIMQMLNLLNLLNLQWPSPFSWALDVSAIVGFGIENINANCVVRLEPIKSYLGKAFGVVVLLLVVLIIHGVHMGILNCRHRSKGHRSTLIGSTGTVFAACFISVASSIFAPFQCDLHPNGKQTLTAFSTVVCWSADHDSPHTTLVAMAMLASNIPLIFLVICIYVTWTLPKRLDAGDTKVLHSYAFLFNKYSPETFWFALVFLIRNLLAALVRVSQDKTVQIFMLAMVWMPVLILLSIVQPWRVPLANYLDIVTETCFLLLLVLAALLVETTNADAPMIGTLSGVLLVVLIVGYALGFAVGVYTRMKEVYGEKLRNQKRIGYYMCYSRQGAGCFARLLGDGLGATRSGEVFQHADASNNMGQWFSDVASHTDMLVVICTKHVLITPWCLGELALAQRHRIPAALVILPDFDWPSENFILNISDYVRGLVQLAPYSISKAMVQEALRGLSRCPRFHVPLQPDLESADSIIKSLVALRRAHAGNDAPPAPALVPPNNFNLFKARTFIVLDLTNLEAASAAFVLENMVNPLLSNQESPIKCWQSTERLPDSAEHVIVICSHSCFHQHGLVEHLLDAAERKLPVLPVIVELGFRFPSPVQPEDVDGRFSHDWVTVDRVIQDVFHHSAVLFQPQNPKLILDGQAVEVAQRLEGNLTPLCLEKPNTFDVRLTIDELEGFLVTDKNRGCFFNILGHCRDDPDTKFQTSYRGATELEWYSQFQLEVGDGDTLELEVMEDNGAPYGRTSITLWPSQLQANIDTDLEPRPLELRMNSVKGCLRARVMLMGTRISHKKISGVSRLSEEYRRRASQSKERHTCCSVAAIREDEGDEEKSRGRSELGGWVLEKPRTHPEFTHPNSVEIHEPHEDGLKVAVIDTDISIMPLQDNDGGSLSPTRRTLTPLAPFLAADTERQSLSIHAWKSPPPEITDTGSPHRHPWSSPATPISPTFAEPAAVRQPPSALSRVVPMSEQHKQFQSRVTKMNDLSSMLEAKKAQIGQRGAGGSTSVSIGASWRQPVEDSTAQPIAGWQGTFSQPLQPSTTAPAGDVRRDTASKSTSASSGDRGGDTTCS